jgi:hypothetical protein
MTPYTYLLYNTVTRQFYYGVRYSRNCDPSDFWVKYRTSSKRVAALIQEHGADSFVWEIRRTFDTRQQAQDWETRVLRRLNAKARKDFLNEHNNCGLDPQYGDDNPMRNPKVVERWKATPKKKRGPQTEEHRAARSRALTGRKRSDEERQAISRGLSGYKHSEEFRAMRSRIQTGKTPSQETRDKKRQAILGRKRYTDGSVVKFFHPDQVPAGWSPK